MTPYELAVVMAAFACVAALYSSVGHAGASGYLAMMALLGVAPATMRPTALALNLVVATLATYRFWRAGWIRWRVLASFAVASVPLAYLGGRIQLPVPGYRALVGVVLEDQAGLRKRRMLELEAVVDDGNACPSGFRHCPCIGYFRWRAGGCHHLRGLPGLR